MLDLDGYFSIVSLIAYILTKVIRNHYMLAGIVVSAFLEYLLDWVLLQP